MNKAIVVLLFLFTALPLFGQKGIDLNSDKSLNAIFNETEIEGFGLMIEYVDNMVLNRSNEKDIINAYHLMLEEIAHDTTHRAPFEENVKYQFLESIDSSAFNAVWRFDPLQEEVIIYRDTVYRNLENFRNLRWKPANRYMDYLKEIGNSDPYFESLQIVFDAVGNMSAGSALWFEENHSEFDFNIVKNRLWATIFLLSMEENHLN